jgi:hypothetical protein
VPQREEHNAWYCEKCQATVEADQQDWRYLFSAAVTDHTGTQWMTAFSEAVRSTHWRRLSLPCPRAATAPAGPGSVGVARVAPLELGAPLGRHLERYSSSRLAFYLLRPRPTTLSWA